MNNVWTVIIALFVSLPQYGFSQLASNDTSAYEVGFASWLKEYKHNFLTDSHSPLSAEDTAHLLFFPPQESYQLVANVQMIEQPMPLVFRTSSEKKKSYDKYAVLSFVIDGKSLQLTVFSSGSDSKYLFLPFKDATNGRTTYGGGRYIELLKSDIDNGAILVDFNKAYNPYCAFSSGYSCPIPPPENTLEVAINAGALLYTGSYKHAH